MFYRYIVYPFSRLMIVVETKKKKEYLRVQLQLTQIKAEKILFSSVEISRQLTRRSGLKFKNFLFEIPV